ncbi:MAG: hypothetical protein WEB03_16380 [Nitriliruptor sp.]|uniref:hypothetical protein n=1 Tax=Nitriliruptor sp. TaxID=2448056 RepID=UPI0034A06DF9
MSERPPLPPLRDDGLPTLPTGEPVLHRWFVIAMLILVPIGIVVMIWAATFLAGRETIPPAERRPAGDEVTTVDRGDAVLGTVEDAEPGPSCTAAVSLIGDPGARAAGSRALGAACALLRSGQFPAAESGLREWTTTRGQLRFAVFELSGVESSLRATDDQRIVLELNAAFQFEDATRAAPAIIGQLTLLGEDDFPGTPISAEAALTAAEAQLAACDRLVFPEGDPRGCLDVEELLDEPDPLASLIAAGYRPGDG